ncbi:MAG TPA: helix-turn-helix domain-containing protein [Acetobacteraceae bacterium]|nr:helix-turn-helix domain-containing protein [Acetobacteraceae bacterium]
MPRYPKQPLEDKLAWMRDRQNQKKAEEDLRAREETRRAQVASGASSPAEAILRDLLQTLAAQRQPVRPAPAVTRQMLRVGQVAEILSVSARTVQRWFADRAVIVQGPTKTTMLIPQQALDDWLREHAPKVS